MGIEEEIAVSNVYGVSCFHEGTDDCHWAERLVLSSRSEANGVADESCFICLGEICWHQLHEIVGKL
jgi:hypothetical protein